MVILLLIHNNGLQHILFKGFCSFRFLQGKAYNSSVERLNTLLEHHHISIELSGHVSIDLGFRGVGSGGKVF